MTQRAPSLQDLMGKPLWAAGRAANLQWFQFGRRREVSSSLPSRRGQVREVGELALHVQSPWRLRVGADLLVGSYDLNFPWGVFKRSDIPNDFDWQTNRTRLDELIETVRANLMPAEVINVIVGMAGAFTLLLRGDLWLEVFPNATSQSEHWRLFVPGDSELEHLVHEAEPCRLEEEGSVRPAPSQGARTSAHASVRFMGDSLDPLEVTKALRLPCDHSHRSGEPRVRRRRDGSVHEYAPYREGMWSMSSEGHVSSQALDLHIHWILEQLEPRKAAVERLLDSGVIADIYCYSAGSTSRAPELPSETIARCAALSIAMGIDHYEVGEDE
jgi:hypothetical protein